jgi:mono/diheme cytochrome c family protein
MKYKNLFSILILIIFLSAFAYQDKKPWPVPEKFNKMANPVAFNDESIKAGKELWAKHCQSCHGKSGLGDGSKAAQLKTEPGDFSQGGFQKQPDGAIFYKLSEGREDMPSFKKKLTDDEDRWQLVNYVRTFGKKGEVKTTNPPAKESSLPKKEVNTVKKDSISKNIIAKKEDKVVKTDTLKKDNNTSIREELDVLKKEMEKIKLDIDSLKMKSK